ncbi:hypothetical protein LV89_01245 [Arcicella aurantiaca]|uniref:Outer membrane protein with beta-barrel domain n=1 Tax=Arcicella aurantiaca TaxID=591202 RepID=A0A316EBK5_9BACT|nr:hypothetical protein [Arcicella aurantiaca]PWK27838.1 hypothetical protein LV89_01245 [Arcicella aurantiaca]
MKKLLTFSFLLALLLTASQGFSQAYKQGDKYLNATIGLNSYYSTGLPLGASFEVGITDAISVGGQADYASGNYGSGLGFTAFYIGARGAYHLGEVLKINSDKVDLYAGLGLGYRSFSWKDGYNGTGYSYGNGLDFNYFIGGRYFFSDNIGAVLELGYSGVSNARAGLTFKF